MNIDGQIWVFTVLACMVAISLCNLFLTRKRLPTTSAAELGQFVEAMQSIDRAFRTGDTTPRIIVLPPDAPILGVVLPPFEDDK